MESIENERVLELPDEILLIKLRELVAFTHPGDGMKLKDGSTYWDSVTKIRLALMKGEKRKGKRKYSWKFCFRCGGFEPLVKFGFHPKTFDKKQTVCQNCNKEVGMKAWEAFEKDKE